MVLGLVMVLGGAASEPIDAQNAAFLPDAAAVTPARDDPFQWNWPSQTEPEEVLLRLAVPTGYLVFRDRVEVRVVDAEGVRTGVPMVPRGRLRDDPVRPGRLREVFDRDVWVRLPVDIPERADAGTLSLELRHQGCRPGLCFPEQAEWARVEVTLPREDQGEPQQPSDAEQSAP